MERIVEILAWPITAIIIVILLRKPLSDLVVTLKKLKYKDLEIEFEREASKILAEAERDLPAPPSPRPKRSKDEPKMMYSLRTPEPSIEIMESWRNLEIKLRALSGEPASKSSTGQIIRGLQQSGKITSEMAKVILELSSLRNRVAHTEDEAISYKVSSSFSDSVLRVMSILESIEN